MSESIRPLARDSRSAVRDGPAGIAERQRAHLADLVTYAHANSPYYRALYQDLPDQVDDPALLPVTDKKTGHGSGRRRRHRRADPAARPGTRARRGSRGAHGGG